MNIDKLFTKLQNIVFTVNKSYTVEYVSPQLESLIGVGADKLRGQLCFRVVAGRTEPCENCPLKGKDGEVVHDIISVNGRRGFFSASFSTDDEVLIENLSDITKLYRQNNMFRHEMKELKAGQVSSVLESGAIKSGYNFLNTIVDSLGYGLLVADRSYKILVLNKTLQSMSRQSKRNQELKYCYNVYGRTLPCVDCPFENKTVHKSTRDMGSKHVTVLFNVNNDYIVESVRDTTRELQLISQIRFSQDENQEKQRQMELMNKDLLRMNTQLKAAQNLINEELRQVGDIQKSLLPEKLPEIPGYEFSAFYTPAEHAGGDYYDCIQMSNDYWGLTIADVSGHGSPAAVIMAMVRAIMRSYTYDVISSSEVLGMVNEILCDNVHTRDFVTMFYAVLNSREGYLNYASAGHNPVLHFDKSEMIVRKLTAQGLFLATFKGIEYEEKSLRLDDGDILFMYTDGLVEAMNSERQQYGLDRVISRIIMYHDRSSEQIIAEIMDDVGSFTDNSPFDDDVTILMVKKKLIPKAKQPILYLEGVTDEDR